MTCAACSARVEKAARTVNGVQDVAVNLLKNRMEVELDGAPGTVEAVERAVEKAGYGAFARPERGEAHASAAPRAAQARPVTDAAAEARLVRTRLIVSAVFTVPLFYLSMATCSAGRCRDFLWARRTSCPSPSRSFCCSCP